MGKFTGIVLFGLAAAMMMSGCAPKTESSNIRLEFPDWQAMREADLARQKKVSTLAFDSTKLGMVVVNVTGPGIANPIFFAWENHDNGGATAPTSVTLDVPKGSARLVQVLATYEGTGTMQFYYADRVKDISTDTDSVELALVNVASASNLMEGKIVGRYLDSASQGYTGRFQYRFTPPGGKPSMVVHIGEMFSGWMDLFALSDATITYTKPDGSPLFSGMTNSTDSLFDAANAPKAMRIRVPAGFYNDSHNSGSYDMKAKGEERYAVGFFGPGATVGKRVCFDQPSTIATAVQVDGLYKTASATDPSATPSNPFKFVGHLAPVDATTQVYVEAVAGIKGGSQNPSCQSAGTVYQDYLPLKSSKIGHGDSMIGLRGPFRKFDLASSDDQFLKVTYDSATQKLKAEWKYLPGVANVLGGASVFYRTVTGDAWSDDGLRQQDGFDCAGFRENAKYSPSFSEIKVSASVEFAEISGVSSASVAAKTQVIVCPQATDGTLYTSAIKGVSNGGGCANCSSPATRLAAIAHDGTETSVGTPKSIQLGTCYPIRIRPVVDSAGTMIGTVTNNNLYFSIPGGDSIHNEPTCSVATPQPFGGLAGDMLVYLKTTRSVGSTGTITFTNSAGGLSGTFNYVVAASTTANQLKAVVPAQIYAHECVPVQFQMRDSTTQSISSVGTPSTFDSPAVTGLQLFAWDDFGCQYPQSYISIAAGQSTFPMKMKYAGSLVDGSTLTIAPTIFSGSFAGTVSSAATVIRQPAAASNLRISSNDVLPYGDCIPLEVQSVDPSFRVSPASAAMNVVVSASPSATFYLSAGCYSAGSPSVSVSFAVGQVGATVYYKPTVMGATVLSATSDLGGISPASRNVTVQAGAPARVVVGFPGQIWSSGTYVGEPLNPILNQDYKLQLRALTSTNILVPDPALLSSLALNLISSGGAMVLASAPVWNSDGTGWVKVRFTTSAVNITVTTGGASGLSTVTTYDTVATLAQADRVVMASPGPSFFQTVCQPVLMHTTGGVAYETMAPLTATASMTMTGAGYTLYSTPSCAAGSEVTSVVFSPADPAPLYYFKSTSVSPSVSATGPFNFTTLTPSTSGSGAVAAPTKLNIVGMDDVYRGACQPYVVVSLDSNNNASGIPGFLPITLSATVGGGAFYSDAACTTPLASDSVTLSGGASTARFYYKPPSPGAMYLNATPQGGYTQCGAGAASSCSGAAFPLNVYPNAL